MGKNSCKINYVAIEFSHRQHCTCKIYLNEVKITLLMVVWSHLNVI